MVNTNITAPTAILDTRLWAGVGSDDTTWQTGAATGTISMAIVELTITDGDAAAAYDLALATNPVTGTEIIGILGVHNITTAGGNAIPVAGNVSTTTLLKFTGAGSDADKLRITFLYR
jgi:hypothetical protein